MKTISSILAVIVILVAIFWIRSFGPCKMDKDSQNMGGIMDSPPRQEVHAYTDAYIKIFEGRQKLIEIISDINRQKEILALDESIIEHVSVWLNSHQPGDILSIGGQNFDYDIVIEDIEQRVDKCENIRDNMSILEEIHKLLVDDIAKSKDQLKEAICQIKDEKIKQEMLVSFDNPSTGSCLLDTNFSECSLDNYVRYPNRHPIFPREEPFFVYDSNGINRETFYCLKNDLEYILQYCEKYLTTSSIKLIPFRY